MAYAIGVALLASNVGSVSEPVQDVVCGAPGPLANSACIVPAGRVQLDGDFVDFAVGHTRSAFMRSTAIGIAVLKAPIASDAQLEMSAGPLLAEERIAKDTQTHTLGAVGIRYKKNVIAGSQLSVAIAPFVQFAALDGHLTSRGSKAGAEMDLATPLGHQWTLTWNPKLFSAHGQSGMGTEQLAALSRLATPNTILVIELDSQRASDGPWDHRMVLGVDYTPASSRDRHWDLGIERGLSSASPDWAAYLGFSFRY